MGQPIQQGMLGQFNQQVMMGQPVQQGMMGQPIQQGMMGQPVQQGMIGQPMRTAPAPPSQLNLQVIFRFAFTNLLKSVDLPLMRYPTIFLSRSTYSVPLFR